jgi:hypothetical protein
MSIIKNNSFALMREMSLFAIQVQITPSAAITAVGNHTTFTIHNTSMYPTCQTLICGLSWKRQLLLAQDNPIPSPPFMAVSGNTSSSSNNVM